MRVNYDELCVQMFGGWRRLAGKELKLLKLAAFATASEALKAQKAVIIDNTNLTPKARNAWSVLAQQYGVPYEEHEIDTSVSECVRRDRLREGKARVGRAVLERMALFNGWIDWTDYGGEFVICDVDGTLADCSHRLKHIQKDWCANCQRSVSRLVLADGGNGDCATCRGPVRDAKDWDAFFAACTDDTPIRPIVRLVDEHFSHYNLLIVSGRSVDQCGIATEEWLALSGIHPLHLFMRGGPHDHRPDYEVKQEILDLLPKDRIAYVIDDRPQVLRMWQANGLTTLAVGNLKEF